MFGEKLAELRRQTRRTQEETAKLIGVAKTTYASYEQNKRTPDTETQNRIADLFGVTLDYLHGRNQTPNWADKKDTIDLRDFLDNNLRVNMAFDGEGLTEEETEKLKIAMTQIFWDKRKQEK